MKVITAKVLATGKEIVAVEKSDDANVFIDQFGGCEYKADELEIKDEREVPDGLPVGGMLPFPFPEHDPFNPQDIIEKMLTTQQGNF